MIFWKATWQVGPSFFNPLLKVEGELDFANQVSRIQGEAVKEEENEENTADFEGFAQVTEEEEEEELKASEKGQVESPGGKLDSGVRNSLNDDALLPSNALDLRLEKREFEIRLLRHWLSSQEE